MAPPTQRAPASTCAPGSPRRTRRLSRTEYERVASGLLGRAVSLAGLAPDPRVDGFDNNADALVVTADHAQEYARVAEQIAAELPLATWAPCANEDRRACAQAFVAAFSRRAWGRGADAEETARLLALFDEALGSTADAYADGVRLVAAAILTAPSFVYRTELGRADATAGLVRLTADEVANQLAFAATGTRPDAVLLEAARAGRLDTDDGLLAEVNRLLAQPEAAQHFRRFVISWLGLLDLGTLPKSWSFFLTYSTLVRTDMQKELDRFVDDALADGGGTLDALLGPTTWRTTRRLRDAVYREDVREDGAEFWPAASDELSRPARFDPRRRRGILTLPSFLAVHAAVDRTSPVDRGIFVRVRMLCGSVPSPPPGVEITPIAVEDMARNTREKTEAHVNNPVCAACHRLIDPIGFGFEEMDGIGAFRTKEFGVPVDSRGDLMGTDVDGPFTGPAELSGRLLESRQVRQCFATQLFRFFEGRSERSEDACVLGELERVMSEADPRRRKIADLLLAYARSAAFGRRAADAPEGAKP